MDMEYLYHYTSLSTLALILKNKTLCFNNLLYVDDLEEAQSKDMGKFGKFVYVSCWTDNREESIPLWNLYTSDMHGVRIGLPQYPFKKHYYKKGQYFLEEDVTSYINLAQIYEDNKISIPPACPLLEKVQYTVKEDELYPIVRTEPYPGAVHDYLQLSTIEELENWQIRVEYSFKEIGKYKRKNWSFQDEWRYKITTAPMGLQELNPPTVKKQQEYVRRLEDVTLQPPVQQIFLEIDESAFKKMEVVFGPKMNEAEKIMATVLLEKYAPEAKYKCSCLKIR